MPVQNKVTFSIIVPLFNEEENVNLLIQKALTAVGADSRFLEIVLVDDGSKDATAALSLELARHDKRIQLVRHQHNQGLGGAIRTGLNAAKGDFVLYTDADLPFDFKLIPQLISLAENNRLIAGYRLNRGEGGRRWILTKGYNFLVRLFFGLSVRDVNFACKILPQTFLKKADLNSAGSFIDVEMLLEAHRLGFEIVEHPFVYYPRERGVSTLSRPQVIFNICGEMFDYSKNLFSDRSKRLEFIKSSPLARLTLFSITALISVIIFSDYLKSNQIAAWSFLTAFSGITSFLLGWKISLLATFLFGVTAATLSFWQSDSFLNQENYLLLIWAVFCVFLSQLSYRSWQFLQKSLKLNTSE